MIAKSQAVRSNGTTNVKLLKLSISINKVLYFLAHGGARYFFKRIVKQKVKRAAE